MALAIGALFLEEVTSTLGDIGFILILMAFCYLAFWASQAFGSNVLIFTLVLAILAYIAFAWPVLLLILSVMVLLMFQGMTLQNVLQFGLEPIGRAFGIEGGQEFQAKAHQEFMESQAMAAEERYRSGNATPQDVQLLQAMQQQQQAQQGQQLPMRMPHQ